MIKILRSSLNPLLEPSNTNLWEKTASFNPSAVKDKSTIHLLYRAVSEPINYLGIENMTLSTIGHCVSNDGLHFSDRKQLIKPEEEWEEFGCEDPRITKLGDKYYIFYTSLSTYPFSPPGIRIGVALTHDLSQIEEKHPVTIFNSKAMTIFPEKIDGKIWGILTIHTDMPPAKICTVAFENEKDIWSEHFWRTWYDNYQSCILPLERSNNDQVEVGASPIKTPFGWLILYSYIHNYHLRPAIFGIEAALLDINNPNLILAKTNGPILIPEKEYELYGNVPNIVFPGGVLLNDDEMMIYYGAADTTSCVATCKLNDLLTELLFQYKSSLTVTDLNKKGVQFERFEDNPIIKPDPKFSWESKLTFNPAAVYYNGKVHIFYRAMGNDNTSVIGYAVSNDGVHINEKLDEPIYIPRESFEAKIKNIGDSGCEDPRVTIINDRLYLCYTAYDGVNNPRVALSSLSLPDFNARRWNWEKAVLISPPGIDDKNTCILPGMSQGKYVFLHRFNPYIWIDFSDTLNFDGNRFLSGNILLRPRPNSWDSEKIGITGPPVKTKDGWLLIYHGLSKHDWKYRLGAALLNPIYPNRVLARLEYPILEPERDYELKGLRPGTVFSCGIVTILDMLFVYYGGADQYSCVAWTNLNLLLKELTK